MTPEEQRLMAQFLAKMDPQSMVAGGGMPKGMTNPYTTAPVSMESQVKAGLQSLDPANMPTMTSWKDDVSNRAGQSTDAARARLANQQAYADQLKATAMPEGQSVGPSGIYVRNPWDSAAAGAQRLMGGYMQGNLNKEYDRVGDKESEIKTAAQRLAQIAADEQQAYKEKRDAVSDEQWGAEQEQDAEIQNARREMEKLQLEANAKYRRAQLAQGNLKTIGEGQVLVDAADGSVIAEGGEKTKPLPTQLKEVSAGRPARLSNLEKAVRFLKAFNSGAQSGTSRKAASFVPGTWSDQGKFDQELDAFAEMAARQALKAAGEIRPTDPDVEGAKKAIFGIGKDENVNRNLLKAYIDEQIAIENNLREAEGLPPIDAPDTEGVGEKWYDELFGNKAVDDSPEDVARPKTEEDFAKLPRGAIYIDPEDGKKYRKR